MTAIETAEEMIRTLQRRAQHGCTNPNCYWCDPSKVAK